MARMTIITAALAAATLTAGCADTLGSRPAYSAYDYNRPDPAYNGYYADRYYREDPRYRERVLSSNERIYRGENGQYYCRRPDGTTGLIVGGIAGGVLGSAIAPGGSGLLGALIGGALGAAGGQAVDRNNVRCK